MAWIKIDRKITDHWIWNNPVFLKAWITLIIAVNYEEKKSLIHGELISCKRGQSLFSLNTWVKQFGKGWTVQKVRTFFELLKNDSMIEVEGLRKTTRLTICNYESYQEVQQTNNTQRTDKQHTDNTQITSTKEYKELKKKSKIVEGENWRTNFDIYLDDLRRDYLEIKNDLVWISEKQKYHPNLNIPLTLEKSCVEFWATKKGWANKKKSKIEEPDWKATLTNALSQPQNKVYNGKNNNNPSLPSETEFIDAVKQGYINAANGN